ncbi:hypothetical protein BFP72_12505 [Reichenbachiella sp. 5M10]|uniref:DUF1501 domain-containing protein n=1 Tax=Reichenbachiella sp. 5M10 TaxID=1889772 RepID=UPI000C1619AB|nr:DUF1501 domain-containing protein [Reichenbachiella sp. 5M10]PIB36157.1 hypothetical protein BFP72_12505 [Reichenbachiella sp. 5M10]
MKRRKFLKNLGFAAGAPIAFQGIPIQVLAGQQRFQKLAAQSSNDNVLIMLQMHGGNDGLNTVIPIENYSQYYSRRPNIAIPYKSGNRTLIPLDSTVPSADQVGLHPDMEHFKDLYDKGKAAVFQGVSYENNNGSHFRGRDIQLMGGGSDDYFSSGWIGRYLNHEYAPASYPEEFPNGEMPDPLALEIGNDVSLLFHQEGNIPTSISLPGNPQGFADLVENLEGYTDEGLDPRGTPPEFLNPSRYGKEMDWLLSLEDKSETYIKRLAEIYQPTKESSVSYPEKYPFGDSKNRLSDQLRLIARLLSGGIKTKVFLVKIGGFDTHAEQTTSYDPTLGLHSALLYHISSAMSAFDADLRSRGLSERVLTVTMSEFGRRIASNGSYGTDHGTGGPVMMFGAGVNAGIYGTNPDLSKNNVDMQFDYRQLYANLLHEWMGVDQSVIQNDIFYGDFISGPSHAGGNYEPLDLIKEVITSTDSYVKSKFQIESIYPNPATNYVQASVMVNDHQVVTFELIDSTGRVVSATRRDIAPGKHTVSFQLKDMLPGFYFIKAKSPKLNDTKRLLVRK